MAINGLGNGTGGPYYYPDSPQGSQGPGNTGSNTGNIRAFKNKVTSDAKYFLTQTFMSANFAAHFEVLGDGSLEISPKRKLKTLFRKQPIPEDFIKGNVAALNTHFDKKSLGRFSYSHDPNYGSYRINFEAQASDRDINNYLLSTRNPIQGLLSQYVDNIPQISKKDAFVFYQAMGLLEDIGSHHVFSCAKPQEQSISVIVDSNYFAEQFEKELKAMDVDLKLELGFSYERPENGQVFRLRFQPDWNNAVYRRYENILSDRNIGEIQRKFNVHVKDD